MGYTDETVVIGSLDGETYLVAEPMYAVFSDACPVCDGTGRDLSGDADWRPCGACGGSGER